MTKRLLMIFVTIIITMPVFVVAETRNEEKKYFSIETPKDEKSVPVLYRDSTHFDDEDFFRSWLTGELSIYDCGGGGSWNNDHKQLIDIPAFLDVLQKANDIDVITVRAEGIGPKSIWHGERDFGNVQCNYSHTRGKNNDLFYTCNLRISAQDAKRLAKSSVVKHIVSATPCIAEIKDDRAKQIWAQALKEYAERE